MSEPKELTILGVGDHKPSYEDEWQGKKITKYVRTITIEGKEGPEDMDLHSASKKLVDAVKEGEKINVKPFKYNDKWCLTATAKNNEHLVPASRGGGGSGWRPMTLDEALELEKAKYPSFATSYAKDVITASIAEGVVKPEEGAKLIKGYAQAFLKTMIELTEGLAG